MIRVLLYIATIVVATALSLGGGLLVALELGSAAHGWLVAAAVCTPLVVMGPVLVGAFAAYYDHRSSPESQRSLFRVSAVVAAVDVVAAVVFVLTALSAQAPLWVPVLLVVGAGVLLAVARPLGALFRRSEPPITDQGDDIPGTGLVRRGVRSIATTFVIAAVVCTIGVTILAAFSDRGGALLQVVLLGGQLTFTATAMAAIVVALPLNRALRDSGGRDIGRLQRYAKVVLRGKELPLGEADRAGAVRYARIVPLALQFQLVFTGLLYVAIAFQFVSSAVRGDLGLLPVVFLVAMVVVLAWAIPLSVRRIGRARRYAEQHRPT
ncbi:hypothetical protein BJK06_08380 [Curtobacterium sp. BH-2-1-1]|uniref:hypothetical protein n=1 Tax=Curtobacterium sp. BH-2-1-1 TaxID=1905847 RepID=UPI00089E0583|nr:hypothetical protein [Curtobacterium sp. BH-2-1-1]AOX65768.1 hypothetical protein BJK06_08380 [Curtobacterium sp. BH-2-1-1]